MSTRADSLWPLLNECLTLLIVAIVAAFCEGVMVTAFIIKGGGHASIVLTLGIGLFLFWLLRVAARRIEMHETECLNWRKGALGEYEVGAELQRLSDDYIVFNNVNTAGFGNFDHVVLVPQGCSRSKQRIGADLSRLMRVNSRRTERNPLPGTSETSFGER